MHSATGKLVVFDYGRHSWGWLYVYRPAYGNYREYKVYGLTARRLIASYTKRFGAPAHVASIANGRRLTWEQE